MGCCPWAVRWSLLGLCAGLVGAQAANDPLVAEIERLRAEVDRLRTAQAGVSPFQPPPQAPAPTHVVPPQLLVPQGAGQSQPPSNQHQGLYQAQLLQQQQQQHQQQRQSAAYAGIGATDSLRNDLEAARGSLGSLNAMGVGAGVPINANGMPGPASAYPGIGAYGGASGGPHAGMGPGVFAGGAMAASGGGPDGCFSNPLFASLQVALQKLALLEQDPVEASFQIHSAWENDPSLFEVCPVGLITALVYLSIAQDREWKYKLLHRATYLLYSTPGLAIQMASSRWPMSDRLIRTMYHNSEVLGRAPLHFTDAAAQPRASVQVATDPGVDEAVGLSLQYHDSVKVHFMRVMFYHFYHSEKSPCACRTSSWCLPRWVRHLTNHSVDIWLAGRDEQKTLFRMDRSGCLRSLNIGLAGHHFAEAFDLLFVFEINALMHPQCRIIPARRIALYPTFALNSAQESNFEELGVSVLADDAILKPPNPSMLQTLRQAADQRKAMLTNRAKDRLLVFPADIRPMKGQLDFLDALSLDKVRYPAALQRLRGVTLALAGACDGNQTYCSEVVRASQQLTAEGVLNVVLADQLKDEELAQLYAASLGTVLYSRVDCNPRAIYEGLVADAPFFVTEQTRLPALIQHLGHVSDGDVNRLPEQLADFVDFSEAGGFGSRPREFAERYLSEADVYRKIVEWMDQKYVSGRATEPVIRSEDALSGGLGGLLGGGGSSNTGPLTGLLSGFAGAGGLGSAGNMAGLGAR